MERDDFKNLGLGSVGDARVSTLSKDQKHP